MTARPADPAGRPSGSAAPPRAPATPLTGQAERHVKRESLDHVGLVVGDLDAAERAVRAAGFVPHGRADYEPGRRFHFDGDDGGECERVSYPA